MALADELKRLVQDLSSMQKQAGRDLEPGAFTSYNGFIDHLKNLGQSKIIEMINDYDAPTWWFPSGWVDGTSWGKGYPKILAEALVKSKSVESITDLTNPYYGRSKLSPEAEKVFKKDVLSNPKETIDLITEFSLNGLLEFTKDNLAFMKSVLMLLSLKEIEEHKKTIRSYDPLIADEYLDLVGLT